MKSFTAKFYYLIIIFSGLVFFNSCHLPVECDDAVKSYKYWAGENPPKDLIVLHGQYMQSMHFTLEYRLFLELKPTELWWQAMIEENAFVLDTEEWNPPNDSPQWFKPSKHCKKWKMDHGYQDSRLLQDSLTGISYIYFNQN